MGNDESRSEGETFKPQDWQLVDSHDNLKVWRSRRDPSQRIQQYTIYSSNDEEHKQEKRMFTLRINHPTIVASRFLVVQSQRQLCSSSHQQKLYIEKIPIRLSDIEHIPFPDFLHLYNQCLQGFRQLAKLTGFFPVEEEYIGINEKGIVKVWMNQNYAHNYYLGGKVSEEFMVNSIVEIIQKNIDHNRIPKQIPSVRNFLYRNTDRLTFQQAINGFNEFLSQYCRGNPPSRLDCIDQVGGIWAIANREQEPHQQQHSSMAIPSNYSNQQNFEPEARKNSRPQLIDSQILKNQFPISSPRIETSAIYYEVPSERPPPLGGSNIIPNMQHKALNPSNIKQFTPIVRKQSANFYSTGNQFNPSPVQYFEKKQPFESNKNSNIQIEPRPNPFNYKVSERQQSKSFGPLSSLPQQIKIMSNIQQMPLNQISNQASQRSNRSIEEMPQIIYRERNQAPAVKASLIQMVQPETPIIHEQQTRKYNFESSNAAFLKDIPSRSQDQGVVPQLAFPVNTNSTPVNYAPSSFYVQPNSSFAYPQRIERRPSSSSGIGIFDFNKQTNPLSNRIDSINSKNINQINNFTQNIPLKQQQFAVPPVADNKISNEFNFEQYKRNQFTSKSIDDNNSYSASAGNSYALHQYNNFNNVKQSQYTTIDIEDGKSSEDFLKKLKAFKTSKDPSNIFEEQEQRYQPPSYQKTFQYDQRFNLPNFNQGKIGTSLTNNLQSNENINSGQIMYSAEQFGRNAVSNIISNQSGTKITSLKNTNNTPLKFQNNLDMKYSMFQADDSPQVTYASSYAYRGYQPQFDADIWADMNKLKQ